MNSLEKKVKHLTEQNFEQIVAHYQHLHQNPELSFQEEETAAYVISHLQRLGVSFRSGIGSYKTEEYNITGHSILAWIEGRNPPSKTIALRADMDALPITEKNNISFKSKNEGVMHACGHDTHTSSLLSALEIIHTLKEEIEGTVLFLFQAGEEREPGGANLALKDGVFDQFKPDAIIAQHAYVDYLSGTVGFESGIVMASADEVHLTVRGHGGHGAIPHQLNDTVLAASQIIISMQQVVSRLSNPFKPMVLSFGKFIADGATNIIPDEVVIAGSLRCMDEEERQKAKEKIKEVALYTAKAYGCECEIRMPEGYPCVLNNNEVTELMRSFAKEYLPENNVLGLPKRMTAEDFGFFSQLYPCTFYRFGIKGKHDLSGLHTSTFLVDQEALRTSTGLLAYLAIRYLSK